MKKALVIVLCISALIELYLGLGVLLKPEQMMSSFGIASLTGDISYMAAIIGWFCLLTTAAAVLSALWVWQSRREGVVLAVALGLFWVGIGLHLGFGFARPQHLGLDAAKGLLILILALMALRKERV